MNNKKLYEKIGYKNIFHNLSENDIRLLKDYILPLYIRDNKKTYPICTCGYTLENAKNSKCFVCNNETMYLNEYYYHSEYINTKNKMIEIDTFNKRYYINKINNSKAELLYSSGVLLFEINEEQPILNLNQLKENNITINIEQDSYIVYYNGEKIKLFDIIFILNNYSYRHYRLKNMDDIFIELFLTIENHPISIIEKVKKYKETFELYSLELNNLEKDYEEKQNMHRLNRDGNKESIYRKELRISQDLFNKKRSSIYDLKDNFTKEIFKYIFNKELKHLNSNLRYLILNEILGNESNHVISNFMEKIDFFIKDKQIKNISNFEDIFYLPEDLYFIIRLKMNSREKDFSLLKKIKKENFERFLIFFEQKDKLNQYNLSPESYYQLLMILNKIDLNMDELVEYIDHLVEHEGLVPIEVLEYYEKYVKKSSLKKLTELPMPVNLKLNANKK